MSDSIRMLKRAAPATTKEYHGSRAAVTTMGCFRECDVRGTYPDEVDEQLFRAIGGAIARRFRGEGQIVVAHDVRVSSCSLSSALIEGIVGCGGHVVDLGLVPTPVVYFNRSQLDAAAGVIVTASHNPPQYNGIKLLFRNGPATCQNIIEISKDLQRTVPVSAGGTCNRCDGLEEYGTQMQRRWDSWTASTPITRFPAVVLDPGNGTWSRSAKQFLERLGASCRVLHDDPDGTFPGRSPDCASPGSLARLGATVREYGAEAGLAWDGDGDRLAVVDASGKSLTADQVGLLLALNMPLRGERVLVDIKMSRKVAEAIAQRGGIPVVERSAHCALERTMIKRNCLFGCEYSGHYFFRELRGADDGFYAALRLIHLIAQNGSLDEMLATLPTFHVTPDIRVPGGPVEFNQICASLSEAPNFRYARISNLDGHKLELPGGWLLIRQSVSEDKLSVRAEGEDSTALASILEGASAALPSSHGVLREALESWIPARCSS